MDKVDINHEVRFILIILFSKIDIEDDISDKIAVIDIFDPDIIIVDVLEHGIDVNIFELFYFMFEQILIFLLIFFFLFFVFIVFVVAVILAFAIDVFV